MRRQPGNIILHVNREAYSLKQEEKCRLAIGKAWMCATPAASIQKFDTHHQSKPEVSSFANYFESRTKNCRSNCDVPSNESPKSPSESIKSENETEGFHDTSNSMHSCTLAGLDCSENSRNISELSYPALSSSATAAWILLTLASMSLG